jgi:DNA-binding NarL/FixJ family response regulator
MNKARGSPRPPSARGGSSRRPWWRWPVRARTVLGEEAYQAAYRAGRDLSPREAVGYAVEPGPLPVPPPDEPAQPSPLTLRESQVALLIAEGLPNKQIATRLLISQRTAESHVENILAKLGFTSRTQVATWVAGGMG